jgi:dipeptidase
VPFYPNVDKMPEYLSNTGKEVSTDNFYWNCKLIAALADASYGKSLNHIERYQLAVQSKGHEIINKYDAILAEKFEIEKKSSSSKVKKNSKIEKLSTTVESGPSEITQLLERANEEMAAVLKEKTAELLNKVLFEASNGMKNQYARSDA